MNEFKDLKVVELAGVLAGPAVGMFFAELGAQVTKIENKQTGGDVTRLWKLPSEDPASDVSAYYCSVNWHKQTLLLDLTDQPDRDVVYDLIKGADIVISNFKPSSARHLGMDYETLRRINPGLIYGQLTAFGENVELPAFDVVLQAEAGFLYMTGEEGREPVKMPVALIDLLAAHQLKEGILVALLRRYRTGEGAYVSVSLLESAIASLANQATNWLMAGHIPQPIGCRHPNIAPYGDIFYTKDDKAIVLAVGTERQFKALCECLSLDELAHKEEFSTNTARVSNRAALRDALAPVIAQVSRDVIMALFHEYGVPAGSIRNMKEVFELPQARKMILEEELPDGRMSRRVRTVAFGVD